MDVDRKQTLERNVFCFLLKVCSTYNHQNTFHISYLYVIGHLHQGGRPQSAYKAVLGRTTGAIPGKMCYARQSKVDGRWRYKLQVFQLPWGENFPKELCPASKLASLHFFKMLAKLKQFTTPASQENKKHQGSSHFWKKKTGPSLPPPPLIQHRLCDGKEKKGREGKSRGSLILIGQNRNNSNQWV